MLLLFVIVLFGCSEEKQVKNINNVYTLLQDGSWELTSTQERSKRYRYGMHFSEDKQLFYLDSQGHIIPPHSEIIYAVSGDTMRVVDYKYEEKFIHEKGTDIYVIQKLNNDELTLEALFPEENVLEFRKRK